MPKSKLSAFLSLALVFASGALVGVVGHRLYTVNTVASTGGTNVAQPPRKMDPEEFRRRAVADMKANVHLDDQQVVRLNEIYDQTREQFDQLNKKRNDEAKVLRQAQTEKIRAMLRPDQLPLFEEFHAKREAEREAERKRHREGLPPSTPAPK